MTDTRSTYEIAAQQIAAYVKPIGKGDLGLGFELRDQNGRRLSLTDDHLSGKPLLLVFLNQPSSDISKRCLQQLATLQDGFDDEHLGCLVISANSSAQDNDELRKSTGYTGPVLGDSTGAVFASYGLHKSHGLALRIIVLTRYRQIRTWFDDPDKLEQTLENCMTLLKEGQIIQSDDQWQPEHAPVLAVPNVLSKEECSELIRSVESGGPFTVRPPRPGEIQGDYKMPVYEHDRQDRVDHVIKDEATLQFLDQRLFSRVTPMIKKAFAYDVTRREDLHVARYAGKRGGNLMGHRDNVSAATAYRRFALSLNLNDDYEGGAVAFKEFGSLGYKSVAGTALVFSSALLHEVLETTQGVRYTLISHFFNEASLPKR